MTTRGRPYNTPESPLTHRQAEILNFICDHILGYRSWPSLRQIMDRFALGSTNSAVSHLKAMVSKGYLDRRGDRLGAGYDILKMPPGHDPFSVTSDGAKIRVVVLTTTLTNDEACDLATRIMTEARAPAAQTRRTA